MLFRVKDDGNKKFLKCIHTQLNIFFLRLFFYYFIIHVASQSKFRGDFHLTVIHSRLHNWHHGEENKQYLKNDTSSFKM